MVRLVVLGEKSALENARALLDLILDTTVDLPVSFQLWDGTLWPDEKPRPATLIFNQPGAVRRMFESLSERGLGEAYVEGRFDVAGSLEAACGLVDGLARFGSGSLLRRLKMAALLRRLPPDQESGQARSITDPPSGRVHSLGRDREAIAFHYDLSNDFYRLWLDTRMVYSCAHFSRPDEGLTEAQEAKLDLICRKLRLKAGDRLLDVGCGWGGLALYAAEHYGAEVLGITLSRRQEDYARGLVERSRWSGRVRIERIDYREIPPGERFDAIVSVGMAEHVGRDHLESYFNILAARLKPRGVLMNHAIGEARPRKKTGASFIDAHVFPDGDIPALPHVLGAAERAGLEIRDVENLREHYVLTLRHWVERLEARREDALALVNEVTFRTWRLYMAASAFAFDRGYLAVYQTLLSKADACGRSGLPLTRKDWYRD